MIKIILDLKKLYLLINIIKIYMEKINEKKRIKKLYIGKKVKKDSKIEEPKIEDENKDSILFETSTELSMDNLINLEEKIENNSLIPGLDDLNVPNFFNDITKYKDINKKIKKYYETKKEIGNELAELYLIDVHRIYEQKKKIK